MKNARLDEAQAGIRIAKKNINNLRYTDGTTLVAESEGKWKSLLMKVKEKNEKKKKERKKVKSFSHVLLFVTPWTVAYQASLSMGFSKQEYWSGVPLSSPVWRLG